MTILNAVRAYLVHIRTNRNLSKRTIAAYENDLKLFARFVGETELSHIERTEVQRYFESLVSRGLSPSTIRRRRESLRVFLRHWSCLIAFPEGPKGSNSRYRMSKMLPKALSICEMKALLHAAHSELRSKGRQTLMDRYRRIRCALVIELLIGLGIRIDELCRLDVSDIDLESGKVVVFGKGSKERVLFLTNADVVGLLKRYLSLRLSFNTLEQSLILNRSLKRASTCTIRRTFEKARSIAKISSHYTPHCLRHTFATLLVDQGADVRSVQEILGHSNIATTQIYLQVSRKRVREVLEMFNPRKAIVGT